MASAQDEIFEQYYKEYFQSLKGYAHASLQNWDIAEEITQDTFHTAWIKIDNFIKSPNPMGWLVNTLKFKIKNYERKRQHYLQLILETCEIEKIPSHTNSSEHEYDLFNFCKTILTDEDFYIIYMVIIQGITHAEISQKLGISLWACQKRVQRILKKLRDALEK